MLEARSYIYGHYYLSGHPTNPHNPSDVNPNKTIQTEWNILRHVVSSAAEAETGGIFTNAQKIIPIQTSLIELDHLQPKTTFNRDNSNSKGYSA